MSFPPSSRSAAVIAEANFSNLFSLLLLKYCSVICECIIIKKTSLHTLFIIHVKIFCELNFHVFHYPWKFLINKVFPDYGKLPSVVDMLVVDY